MFPHSVTIYSSDGDQWARRVIDGVLWEEAAGRVYRNTGQTPEDTVTVYVPDTSVGDAGIKKGDRLVKGSLAYEVRERISELNKAGFDVKTVTRVDHRDFGGDMAHWEVGAK